MDACGQERKKHDKIVKCNESNFLIIIDNEQHNVGLIIQSISCMKLTVAYNGLSVSVSDFIFGIK